MVRRLGRIEIPPGPCCQEGSPGFGGGAELLGPDDREQVELGGILAAGCGREDDEPLCGVVAREDLAVEGEGPDQGVEEALNRPRAAGYFVTLPQLGERFTALAQQCDELVGLGVLARCAVHGPQRRNVAAGDLGVLLVRVDAPGLGSVNQRKTTLRRGPVKWVWSPTSACASGFCARVTPRSETIWAGASIRASTRSSPGLG